MPAVDPVARYYDSNTGRFLLVGRAGASHAIHRQLWGPGVRTPEEAADHIHGLVDARLRELGLGPAPTLLDLGCGVGGTMISLAEAWPEAELHGVTISPRQVEIARRLVQARGLAERVHVHTGDFHSTRLELRADAALAIESFVHAASPAAFLEAARAELAEGGQLIVVDDFLQADLETLAPRDRRWVGAFQEGWRAPALCTVAALERVATELGFERTGATELTSLIRLGRPRDRVISVVSPALGLLGLARWPFFGNMVGGDALQRSLRRGVIGYHMLTFRRIEAGPENGRRPA